jgi:DNA processing protein
MNEGRDLPALSDAQRLDWLRLIRSENVGPITFRLLLDRYGGAAGALEALPALARRGGGRAGKIATRADAEREIERLARIGGRFVARGEAGYPPALRHLDSAPPLIAVRGAAEALARRAVAIVGSRNASALGRSFTRRLAEDLGRAGYLVVSGLARGIDAAAHEASLATGTAAVLAGGLDRIYPPENAPLLDKIVETGAALTEMPMGWQAQARDFPRRNRIVAGMALGVVVVEAADRSGSLITARLAGEAGREVFAVPGSPLDPRAAGTNRLLKDGATMVTDAADVIEALASAEPRAASAPILFRAGESDADHDPPADERTRLLDALGAAPVEIDVLLRETGAPVAAVTTVLLELELAGRLERHPGARVSLIG